MPDTESASLDPLEKAKWFFGVVQRTFDPGDLAQGLMVSKDGKNSAMMAIDTSFFASIVTRINLQAMLKKKAKELDAGAWIQVADSFRLINPNKELMQTEPPPAHANVEWLAEHGYGEKQDCLLGICQTPLSTWLIRHDYRVVDEKVEWIGEIYVAPGRPEPYTEVFEGISNIRQA